MGSMFTVTFSQRNDGVSTTTARYRQSRRGGRADDCNGLENRRGESLRGFESPSLRVISATDLIAEFLNPVSGVTPVGVAVSANLVAFSARGGVGAQKFHVSLFHFEVSQTI